jgi:hypothetical protein
MSSIVAARIYALFILAVISFELALAAGMPWGEIAWGGTYHGQLPVDMRLASAFSALLLFAMALVVLTRAGLVLHKWQSVSRKLVWVVVIYSLLGVVANAITPSVWERIIWLPVAIVLLVCSTVVATRNE